ncbi:MAG TPA: hypothetical protein VNM48_08605, partial [Chloroflexota bacterium]|nr:hypothetical protein [Chloroflexota bacterium]
MVADSPVDATPTVQPLHAQVGSLTRDVLAVGYFPIAPDNGAVEVVEIDKATAARLSEPGRKTLSKAGVLTVTPPPPPDPTVIARDEAAMAERTAAHADLHAGAAATMTRIDAIIANGGAYTAAEVRSAVVDMARLQRRLL